MQPKIGNYFIQSGYFLVFLCIFFHFLVMRTLKKSASNSAVVLQIRPGQERQWKRHFRIQIVGCDRQTFDQSLSNSDFTHHHVYWSRTSVPGRRFYFSKWVVFYGKYCFDLKCIYSETIPIDPHFKIVSVALHPLWWIIAARSFIFVFYLENLSTRHSSLAVDDLTAPDLSLLVP